VSIVADLKAQIAAIQSKIEAVQAECSHPLGCRTAENRGTRSTGESYYDAVLEREYWTEHHCSLCDLRWRTGQRWEYEGDRRGMPPGRALTEAGAAALATIRNAKGETDA
jgi:hypothetical protein